MTAAITPTGAVAVDLFDASMHLRRGETEISADLRVAGGETVALLGPNGAGKTSLLRAIAGLVPLVAGWVRVDGDDWERPEAGRWLPAERRSVGFVFQDYLLFPHLSALDNVAYGLRHHGAGRAAARARAHEWLDRMGIADLAPRRPSQLSGGQQQRVALARALAPEPRVLLLDEPLAALDVTTRREVRRDLRAHLDDFAGATVLVSHDPLDAIVLAERIVIVEEGRVVQEGSALEVTSRPRSGFAADIAGLNLYRGRADGGVVHVSDGFDLITSGSLDGPVFATVHPRAVALHLDEPEGSARNAWRGTIDEVDVRGGVARVRTVVEAVPMVAEITVASYRQLGLGVGASVWVSLKATEVEAFEA